MNRENLKTLADYLLSGNLKADFDMKVFSQDTSSTYPQVDCGAIGCAAGHGPYAGIPKLNNERWYEYSRRVFSTTEEEHSWCFSMLWRNTDNTPQGAGKRINYLLEHGLPIDWRGQLEGVKLLCY